MNTARKGDLAVVVGLVYWPADNGKVVKVISDPYWDDGGVTPTGRVIKRPPFLRNLVDKRSAGGIPVSYPTRCLIPIRDPDAEQCNKTRKVVEA